MWEDTKGRIRLAERDLRRGESAKVFVVRTIMYTYKILKGKKNEDASFLRLWFSCRPAGVRLFIHPMLSRTSESKISGPLPAVPRTSSLLAVPCCSLESTIWKERSRERRPEERLGRFMSERLGLTSLPRLLCHHRLSAAFGFLARRDNRNKRTFNARCSSVTLGRSSYSCNSNSRESLPFREADRARFLGVPRVQLENSTKANRNWVK